MSHVDILEQKDSLGRPFIGSLVFHVGLTVIISGAAWVTGSSTRLQLGDPNGGRFGAVMVNPVSIPLPNRGGQTNPLASDTKSQLPTAPIEKPTKKAAPIPDANAIPIPGKTVPKKMPRGMTRNQPETANSSRISSRTSSLPMQLH